MMGQSCTALTNSLHRQRPPSSSMKFRLALVLTSILYLAKPRFARGEDQVDYRFEDYLEEDGRIGVQTQSWLFEKELAPWLSLKGTAVYDAISGATPTGAPP